MTIIVAGDNKISMDSLAMAIRSYLSDAVDCIYSIGGNLLPIEGVSLMLVDYDLSANRSLSALKAVAPGAKIAVYSAPGVAAEAMRWLNLGYDGYLPRSMSASAAACAVQLMLRGERFVPAIAIDAHVPARDNIGVADLGLSPRQREILSMMATGASNKHIARALCVEEVTVKSHVKAIFRKLGVTSRTEAACFVLSPGQPRVGTASPGLRRIGRRDAVSDGMLAVRFADRSG
ncbi:MAG TPA: response regulator transcription factor [Magnetospirillum sp.]|nr:response regulator transcription factor [Magnetospirillum sp.]